jgi:hypothetical protein
LNYKLLLPALLLGTALPAQARWFEIELLAFKRNVPIDAQSEEFAQKNFNIDTSSSIPLLRTETDNVCSHLQDSSCIYEQVPLLVARDQFAAAENGFTYLSNGNLRLRNQRKNLSEHASFEPLLHITWRMNIKSKNHAIPIHLIAGKNYAPNMSQPIVNQTTVETEQGQSVVISGEAKDVKIQSNNNDKWEIDGNFLVYLDHYLFIDSQLIVRQEVVKDVDNNNNYDSRYEVVSGNENVQVIKNNDALPTESVHQYKEIEEAYLNQTTRLESSEIHYIDHPLMGMIVEIRKM